MYSYSLLEKLLFLRATFNHEKLLREITGKTIVITGASSGIGKQVAYELAQFPVHLIIVARRQELLEQVKKEVEEQVATVDLFAADLRQEAELVAFISFLEQMPKGIDFVITNAGLSIHRSIQNSLNRPHDFTRTMAINYVAPVRILLASIPLLKQTNGQIINVSTINTLLIPFPHWAGYQASKTAFDTWLRSASPELRMLGISTTTLYLPLVKTPMIEPTKAYAKMPAMSVQHVANLICKAMYTKKRVIKPWWLLFGQITSILIRRLLEEGMYQKLKRKRN